MAGVFAQVCGAVGCRDIAAVGFTRCERHRRTAEQAPTRRAADAFYSSAAWRRTRRVFLSYRENSYCAHCGSFDSLEVHHVLDRAARPDLALDLANLQTLCAECHGRETAKRQRS